MSVSTAKECGPRMSGRNWNVQSLETRIIQSYPIPVHKLPSSKKDRL
jgi:hypothetical protein